MNTYIIKLPGDKRTVKASSTSIEAGTLILKKDGKVVAAYGPGQWSYVEMTQN